MQAMEFLALVLVNLALVIHLSEKASGGGKNAVARTGW